MKFVFSKLPNFNKLALRRPLHKEAVHIEMFNLFAWLSDPLKGLSDLQLGGEKGTLNRLVDVFNMGFKGFKELNGFGSLECEIAKPEDARPSKGTNGASSKTSLALELKELCHKRLAACVSETLSRVSLRKLIA